MTYNSFKMTDSKGPQGTNTSLQLQLTFPLSGNPYDGLNITIKGPQNTIFSGTVTAAQEMDFDFTWRTFRDYRDGFDFEISINSVGDSVVKLYSGYGSVEERHALTDYRHAKSETNGHIEGATLQCVIGAGCDPEVKAREAVKRLRVGRDTSCNIFLSDLFKH